MLAHFDDSGHSGGSDRASSGTERHDQSKSDTSGRREHASHDKSKSNVSGNDRSENDHSNHHSEGGNSDLHPRQHPYHSRHHHNPSRRNTTNITTLWQSLVSLFIISLCTIMI